MKLGPEERIQAEIVTWMRAHLDCRVVHVPNGGLRSKLEAIRMKEIGVTPGVPDLLIFVPGGRVFFIEVKAPGGSASDAQKGFITILQDWLFDVAIVRSVEEAKRACEVWRLPAKRKPASLPAGAVSF